MTLVRKLSFLTIQMNYTIEDVRKIKLTRTIFQVLIHYLYYIFYKKYFFYKKVFKEMTLYDCGIEIKNSFIPYEYIVSFDIDSIIILAKYENKKFIPFDSLSKICIQDGSENLIKTLKNNMYYHLRYNEVNLEILQFKSVEICV